MIEIADNINEGDLVYAWFTPFKDKKEKKPLEVEYKVKTLGKHNITIASPDGGYSLMFNKELLETWSGNIRRVGR